MSTAAVAVEVRHIQCPTGCNVPWAKCPWCGAEGVPHATMRECKYWSKADCDLNCADCGCAHRGTADGEPHFYSTFMHHEPCSIDCREFVKPLSPCGEWLASREAT